MLDYISDEVPTLVRLFLAPNYEMVFTVDLAFTKHPDLMLSYGATPYSQVSTSGEKSVQKHSPEAVTAAN